MAKILSIEEKEFKYPEGSTYIYMDNYEGYVITTEDEVIKVAISSDQCCCEDWGYLSSEDDLSEFIGAELLRVNTTDTSLLKKEIDVDCGDIMFVNLETSAGLLQFAVYNSHNGYYGHSAVLITKEGVHSETL